MSSTTINLRTTTYNCPALTGTEAYYRETHVQYRVGYSYMTHRNGSAAVDQAQADFLPVCANEVGGFRGAGLVGVLGHCIHHLVCSVYRLVNGYARRAGRIPLATPRRHASWAKCGGGVPTAAFTGKFGNLGPMDVAATLGALVALDGHSIVLVAPWAHERRHCRCTFVHSPWLAFELYAAIDDDAAVFVDAFLRGDAGFAPVDLSEGVKRMSERVSDQALAARVGQSIVKLHTRGAWGYECSVRQIGVRGAVEPYSLKKEPRRGWHCSLLGFFCMATPSTIAVYRNSSFGFLVLGLVTLTS